MAEVQPRHIDLAICLDTSNSMDGLIDSAKQKLWAIVNELATARPRPLLRVGLYQYGNNGLKRDVGWVQKVCDLTDDLDTVYGKLFGLTTNGGTEYVARVIRAATEELSWNADRGTLRIIFVAGNEPATQDREWKLQDICSAAAGKGIIVNTIFCGREQEGRRTGWADGRYAFIDQDRGTVAVNTPFDKRLTELGAKLNTTYVAYGNGGGGGRANQALQDSNALKAGAPAAAERAAAKSTLLYRNAGWDLVDAVRDKKVDLAKLKDEELPEPMRKMTPEQRKEYVEKQLAERARIQKEIQDLNAKRQAHVKAEMEKQGLSEAKAFDAALRAAIRAQAEAKNFTFEK
ncbi:MAG: hypothetical protein AMJ81_00760 [Phycisphaerae bacterium SM23_33]|nr:MAG: hypothetical protein AMJ81_00760 [Phycisphaerae bacterium SM23_33]